MVFKKLTHRRSDCEDACSTSINHAPQKVVNRVEVRAAGGPYVGCWWSHFPPENRDLVISFDPEALQEDMGGHAISPVADDPSRSQGSGCLVCMTLGIFSGSLQIHLFSLVELLILDEVLIAKEPDHLSLSPMGCLILFNRLLQCVSLSSLLIIWPVLMA